MFLLIPTKICIYAFKKGIVFYKHTNDSYGFVLFLKVSELLCERETS